MDLYAEAEQWLDADPDPDTRAELQALIDDRDEGALAERFGERLTFGTAGMRGPLGAGPARMNRAVVRRVTAGLAARLREQHDRPVVVVGRDARHKSAEFLADTVGVLAAAGCAVHAFDSPVPTPLVAYAVRHLDAHAGVQVTASHNPPSDNGYKVYWAGGAQIVAPLDAEISAAIDAITSPPDVVADGVTLLGRDLVEAYLDACLALPLHPEQRDLAVVTTPLHGVAGALLAELLNRGGFTDVTVVPEQAEPDPDFPTVAFPNPEEPGALDLAMALGSERAADLLLANDPDGDRIAVAVPASGGWRLLSGDEVGCLLAAYLLEEGTGGTARTVATTVVSSQLLGRLAEAHGVAYAETLTGFKWLAQAAAQADAEGRPMVLAYEQALGVMAGTAVRDKDGLSAALLVADLAAHLRAQGRTLLDALDDLARRFGVHATDGRSVRLAGEGAQALVEGTIERLRLRPPDAVGGVAVTAVADHVDGIRRRAGRADEPLATPRTPLVGLDLEDGSRLQVRPSGTEPLLKFYVEVVEPVDDDGVGPARARAQERLGALADAFLALADA